MQDFQIIPSQAVPQKRLVYAISSSSPCLGSGALHCKFCTRGEYGAQNLRDRRTRDQDFELARQCLTEQGDVLAEIARLEPKRTDLMPQHVIVAIRLLGYAGELPAP
jgi:hypothetical protein